MSLLLMAALWLLCVGVPGGGAETDVPVYQAPQILAPRARLGGSLRGGEGDDPAIVALVPDHVGMTIKQRPAFNWFLSKHTTIILMRCNANKRKILFAEIRCGARLHRRKFVCRQSTDIRSAIAFFTIYDRSE